MGFLELQKHEGGRAGGGEGFLASHPNFCSRAAVMFKSGQ